MSSSESSDDSSELSDYDLEVDHEEDVDVNLNSDALQELDLSKFAYSEEPAADEEWIAEYENKVKEAEELEQELLKRKNGPTLKSEWCKCKNCEVSYAVNISECYCCHELDGCIESLSSEYVQKDLEEGKTLECVIEHPGFAQVCLQKWSLRLAADKYKKKNKEKYKQTGSEERFLRSVAYREFTRLIHGFLGRKKRVPLPCCAYTAIRKTFKEEPDDSDTTKGFELEDNLE